MEPALRDIETEPDRVLRALRRDIIEMAEHSSHAAVALSCVEIIAALYSGVLNVTPGHPHAPDRDIFILSKGHGCMALYSVLAWRGFIDRALLKTYSQNGSQLPEHPLAGAVPCIEFAAGSLGHGLAVAAGWAKGIALQSRGARVYVLLGDGECDEGSVWEAAAFAAAQGLDNLTAIVDRNGMQACGHCREISRGVSLPACWQGFGWEVIERDGHDLPELRRVFAEPNSAARPRVVICHTVKGKGVDFMEHNLEYHYRMMRGQEKEDALRRLADA